MEIEELYGMENEIATFNSIDHNIEEFFEAIDNKCYDEDMFAT